MSSRFDRLRAQNKSRQHVDPFLHSGISPELIHQIHDPDTVRLLVDSVVRMQRSQIHPDLAQPASDEDVLGRKKMGELESALHQLKSASFPALLKTFRESYPAHDIKKPSRKVRSFAEQFAPLDSLLEKRCPLIPLTALRDVTIELIDLPTLAEEVARIASIPLQQKNRALFEACMTLDPTKATFLSLLEIPIGSTSLFLWDIPVGREIYALMGQKLADIGDPELGPLLDLFLKKSANDSSPDRLLLADENTLDTLAKRVAPLWNEVICSLSSSDIVPRFLAVYRDAIDKAGLSEHAAEIKMLQEFSRNLPHRFLYIDQTGTFFDGGGSGRLQSVPLLQVSQVFNVFNALRYDHNYGDKFIPPDTYFYQDIVELMIEIAVRGEETFSLANPVFFPENSFRTAAITIKDSERGHVFDVDELVEEQILADAEEKKVQEAAYAGYTSTIELPALREGAEILFFSGISCFPPSIPLSFFDGTALSNRTDRMSVHLLASRTTLDRLSKRELMNSGISRSSKMATALYLEGVIERVHRGKVGG